MFVNLLSSMLASMAVVYSNTETKTHGAVVHPGHPAIIDTALLADETKKYKAGTVLAWNAEGTALKAAAPESAGSGGNTIPADTPVAVLTKDSDGKNAEVLVLWHGMVVAGRLLDSSGTNPVAADEDMIFNLRDAGIYPVQSWTSSKKG